MLVHLRSFLHHHLLALASPTRPQPSATPPGHEPLPSIEGCGLINNALVPSEARTQPQPPLPFSKGCGRLIVARRRNGGWWNTKGAQEVGGRHSESRKRAMTIVFSDLSPFYSTNNESPQRRPTPANPTQLRKTGNDKFPERRR